MPTIGTSQFLGLGAVLQQLSSGLRLIATSDGGLTLVAEGPSVTLTVTSPPGYAGAYLVPTAVAETTPIPLRAPVIEGTAAVGATLGTSTALWIFGSQLPDGGRRWRWQRDGVDIPGAESRDYTVSSADGGTTLSVVETFDYGSGSIDISSAGVAA
jgi:hypothetical protein